MYKCDDIIILFSSFSHFSLHSFSFFLLPPAGSLPLPPNHINNLVMCIIRSMNIRGNISYVTLGNFYKLPVTQFFIYKMKIIKLTSKRSEN